MAAASPVLENEVSYSYTNVTLDEALIFLKKQKSEESSDPNDASLVGQLDSSSTDVPVHLNNPAVQLFLDLFKPEYQRRATGWGDFALFSDEVFEQFLSFKATLQIENMAVVNEPLKYYIFYHNYLSEIEIVSENVWLLPSHIKAKYDEWANKSC